MLIGLLGRSRHGKDTVANAIVTASTSAVVVRLSQPLKDAVAALYGFTHEQLESDEKEIVDVRYGITPRVAMTQLCDTIMAQHGRTFFSKRVYDHYDIGAFGAHRVIVVPDVRYEHDIREIHRRGGIIIKVVRTAVGAPDHPWEANIDQLEGDILLVNDDTYEAFLQRARQAALDLVKTNMARGFNHIDGGGRDGSGWHQSNDGS